MANSSGGNNLFSRKKVTMVTNPQPTSQGILQASGYLERGGPVAQKPGDLPYPTTSEAPLPSHPNKNQGFQTPGKLYKANIMTAIVNGNKTCSNNCKTPTGKPTDWYSQFTVKENTVQQGAVGKG